MKFCAFAVMLGLMARASLAAAPTLELVENPGPLSPARSVEIRFTHDMVESAQVGQPVGSAPIEIVPSVEGKWTWQSMRSGIFIPAEPWPLATTIQIRAKEGTRTLAGEGLPSDWRATLDMPAFAVQAWSNQSYRSSTDASALPEIVLLLNATVNPNDVAGSLRFVRPGGVEIPVDVKAPDQKRPGLSWFSTWEVPNNRSLMTWKERFKSEAMPEGPRRNQVFVKPAKPLPVGEDWRLVVAAGLPADGESIRTLNTVEIKIGTVKPFEIRQVEATNYINEGKRLHVRFTKPLPESLTSADLAKWIRVAPAPKDIAGKVAGDEVTYTGSFERDVSYRVTIEPGIPSTEPFTLAQGRIEDVVFEPVPPRLYFEAFDTHQMRAGERKFHLLAINAPKIRVTAKLFAGLSIPVALRGYEGYYQAPKDQPDESYSRIDVEHLPGQKIWDQVIEGTRALDEQQEIALDWSRILGPNKGGAIMLTAEQVEPPVGQTKRPGAQAVVQLTDLAAVWKRSPAENFIHVFSMKTGQGVPGAKVRLLDEKDKPLASGVADGSGIARLPVQPKARWIFVEAGGDSHLVEFRAGRNYIDLARVDVQYSAEEDEENVGPDTLQAFLFTERGVYRPGEGLHLKGILRDFRAAKTTIPVGLKLNVKVIDSRDKEIATRAVTLNALGSFSEDFTMPQSPLGFYRVEVYSAESKGDRMIGSHEFQVEEFKPNAFEILIGEAPKTPGLEEFSVPMSAKYYMGKTLSKSQLNWSIEAHDEAFEAADFPDHTFCDAIRDYRLREYLDRRGGVSLQGKEALDEQGAATIQGKIPLNDKAPQPRSARVLCEVTDINQQTVSQAREFTLHSSDFYLGVRDFRALLHVGEPLPVEVIAVRTDGTPTLEPVAFEAKLIRIDWQTNRVQGADDTTDYEREPKLITIGKQTWKTAAVSKTGDRWTVGASTNQPFTPTEPGPYLLELTTKDSAGRAVATSVTFQVYGAGETAWDYRNPYQVELVPEKDEYTSGETAKILVKTPISGDALITVEREKVLRSFVTRLVGNAPAIEVPLVAGDAPNVFVSVMLLRGADDSPRKHKAPEYRIGYCELKVSRPDAKLTVYVKPGAKAYLPGEEAAVSVEVLDFEGKPVRNAEVTLFAVDEGILSLTGYETPDPLTFFNEPRGLLVSTALTLPSLLSEDEESRSFENKGYLVGGGGDDLNKLRKNFLACAFWNATMTTDALGKVLANFVTPDSLTRYRLMAVVQTARDQFGHGESAVEVNKPVMLEPALPRFANVGDKIALRAVIHNTTDLAGEAEVRVVFGPGVKAETTSLKLPLAAKASSSVDIPVEFTDTGKAVWRWSVRFTSGETVHRDAVQTSLKIGYPAPLLRDVKIRRGEGAVDNLLDGVDPQLLEGRGTVKVSLTNSRAIELQEALEQLLHYPYGCVEQTTSSTLPWLTLRRLHDQLPSLHRTDAEVEKAVNVGINRLFTMQTDSGGLGYWPGATRPMLWGSAYGSLLLSMAKQQGYAVPEEDYDRLMKWMSQELRGTAELKTSWDLRERCLVVYALALAGRAEAAYHTVLFEKRNLLLEEDRAFLALAIAEAKGPATMIEQLLSGPKTQFDDSWFSSPSRTLATQLLCWSRYRPASTRCDELANQLLESRRSGHWWTTQGNVWSVLALGDYIQRTERENKTYSGKLRWADSSSQVSLGARAETRTQTFPITNSAAREPLSLAGILTKGGRLYTQVTVEAYPPLREQPAQDRGYVLGRSYAKIEDDGSLSDAKNLRVGDRVLITLTLEVRQRAGYLAIEDPLPAVFEAVNPSFKTQEMKGGNLGTDWVSDYHELREDRALFFADSVAPGRYRIRYLARVTAAGQATAPCAKVEEMYHPDRCGLTDAIKVATLPLK